MYNEEGTKMNKTEDQICETSVDNYFTRQYIPEGKSELHTHRCENLKSHKIEDV
jgi:hypothetical protein